MHFDRQTFLSVFVKLILIRIFSRQQNSYAKVVGASDTRLHRLAAERTLIAGAFGTRHACPARPQRPPAPCLRPHGPTAPHRNASMTLETHAHSSGGQSMEKILLISSNFITHTIPMVAWYLKKYLV